MSTGIGHWAHIAVGAAIGAVVNTGITALTDYMDDGEFNSGWEAYASAAVEGAITGGVGAATGGASLLVTAGASAASGMVANVAGQAIRKDGQVDLKEAVTAGVLDAGLGVASDFGAKAFMKTGAGEALAKDANKAIIAAKSKNKLGQLEKASKERWERFWLDQAVPNNML